jgi:hypothetical protein
MGKLRKTSVLAAAIVAVLGAGIGARASIAADAPSPPCTDTSRQCVIDAAGTYIAALVSHKGDQVRLAPNARRTENGLETASSGEAIRNDLETNKGDAAISGARDIRWFVDGENAVAYYLLDTSIVPPVPGVHTSTVRLSERFRVVNGLITEIEAIFWVSPGPTPEGSGWPAP